MLSLTRSELRATCAMLRAHLTEGREHEEIATLLGISWTDYEQLLKRFYEQESEDLRGRSTEQVYVDYCINQMRNIKDLTALLERDTEGKQAGAVVGAIRARSDIYDKIISRGQELGFIEKKPETKIVAGLIVSQLSTKELKRAITQELSGLDTLMRNYGDAPNIIDVDPGPTHLSIAKSKALPLPRAEKPEMRAPEKSNRMRRSKRHTGRTVKKKKVPI